MNFFSKFLLKHKKKIIPNDKIKWHRNSILFKTADDRYREMICNYFFNIIKQFIVSDKIPISIILMRGSTINDSDYMNISFNYGDIMYNVNILWKELVSIIINIIKQISPYSWSLVYNICNCDYNSIHINFIHDTYENDISELVVNSSDLLYINNVDLFSNMDDKLIIKGVFLDNKEN